VHISSGVSALVCALYLGKRLGYGKESFAPHNSTLVLIGACLLWVGWFGFNAGSAGNASSLASSAFVATHFATAAAALGWMFAEWAIKRKPTVVGACSGAVAGLVAITPASGYVAPMPGIVIGAVAGVGCYLAAAKVKARFGYDDSLDAFGVHGVGGRHSPLTSSKGARLMPCSYANRSTQSLKRHRRRNSSTESWDCADALMRLHHTTPGQIPPAP
jgi:Amt family ammonium transporter